MKLHSIILITALAILSACSAKEEKAWDKLLTEGSLEDLRSKKSELTVQQKGLDKQIASIDSIIGTKEINKKLPLVTTLTTKKEPFNHFIELQGDVSTKQNILIYPEMAGLLREVLVKEGQNVSKGQLLAKIDDGGMSSQLAQLKTQLALSKTTYERQKSLWDKKIGTEMQFLGAKANYEAQQSTVSQLESQLSKFNIKAPFAGIIDDVMKDQGTVVAPGGPGSEIFRLVNLGEMYIEVEVPESFIANIKTGNEVQIQIPVLDKMVTSKVRQAGNFINPNNRSFKVEIAVPNSKGMIKPNMTAKVNINDYTNNDAILIPQSIISENADGEQYTYIVSDVKEDQTAKAHRIIITTGKSQGNFIEVLSGLKSGDLLIQEGARSVKDGQEVKILSI